MTCQPQAITNNKTYNSKL